jgi:hypothetical protein
MMPLRIAMNGTHTGMARWLADHIVSFCGDYGPLAMTSGLLVATPFAPRVSVGWG